MNWNAAITHLRRGEDVTHEGWPAWMLLRWDKQKEEVNLMELPADGDKFRTRVVDYQPPTQEGWIRAMDAEYRSGNL